MKNKTVLHISKVLLILSLFIILPLVSAQQTSLGTFAQGSTIGLIQTCTNSTYANVTRVMAPNSTLLLNAQNVMTKNGFDYNYSFSSTQSLGQYLVYGNCDPDGVLTNWAYSFKVTNTGEDTSNFDYIPLVLIFMTIICVLLYVGSRLGEEHVIVGTILITLPLFFLIGLAQIGKSYIDNNFSSGAITQIITPVQIVLPWLVFGFMTYISLTLVMKAIGDISAKKREKQGYD